MRSLLTAAVRVPRARASRQGVNLLTGIKKMPPTNTKFYPLIRFTKPNINMKYILTHYCDKQGVIFVYSDLISSEIEN